MKPLNPISPKRPAKTPQSEPLPPHSQVIHFKGPLLQGDKPQVAPSEIAPVPVVIPPPVREAITGKRISEGEENLLIDAHWRHRVRGYNITRPQDPK